MNANAGILTIVELKRASVQDSAWTFFNQHLALSVRAEGKEGAGVIAHT